MKNLLLLSLAFGAALTAAAETAYYTMENLSDVVSVSPNGRYAVTAATDMNLSYIWNVENPAEFVLVEAPNNNKIELYGVTDDGMAVGGYYVGDSKFQPCIVVNGEIKDLPSTPMAMNNNFARCVTADGKVIGGYIAYRDPESEVGMRYRPCFWRLNDQGEYDLELDSELALPEHQGFITNCISPDGSALGGRLYCAAGSEIPALYKDGELIYWNELETKIEPFEYKGQVIGYYENYYIDGMKDGCKGEYVIGEFTGADAWGNFYGFRTIVDWASEDGEDYQLSKYAFVYNIMADEFTDYPQGGGISNFSTGLGQDCKYIFCNGDRMLVSEGDTEEVKSVSGTLGFTNASTMTAVLSASADGRILGGTRQEVHPATGEMMYYPFIVVLDEPLVEAPVGLGVEVIPAEEGSVIVLSAGRVDFAGAEGEVYDMEGRKVGAGSSVAVPAGFYVVKCGQESRKVMVK